MAWRSASPAACPRRSLAAFSPSMSRNRTATRPSVPSAPSRASCSRLRNSDRLPRPVSESWNAWYESSDSRRLRSVTSCPVITYAPTVGSSTRFTMLSSKGMVRVRQPWSGPR